MLCSRISPVSGIVTKASCAAFGIAPDDRKVIDQCLLMFLEDLQLEMESHPVTNAEQIQETFRS